MHRMSFEKADSLLTALSKEKSKKKNPVSEGIIRDTPYRAPAADTMYRAQVDTAYRAQADTTDRAQADTAYRATEDTAKIPAEKNRKKARVAQQGLPSGQNAGQNAGREGEVDYTDIRSVNEGTLLGVGGYRMKDSYLSPEKYGGMGFRFMN